MSHLHWHNDIYQEMKNPTEGTGGLNKFRSFNFEFCPPGILGLIVIAWKILKRQREQREPLTPTPGHSLSIKANLTLDFSQEMFKTKYPVSEGFPWRKGPGNWLQPIG